MLICPQCQFENPDTNKFCQECGTSLGQNVCPECGTLVAFERVNCQDCGAIAGATWWAILSSLPSQNTLNNQSTAAAYLDQHNRYRLLEPLPIEKPAASEACVRVLDCQPFQPSRLELIQFETDISAVVAGEAVEEYILSSDRKDAHYSEPAQSPALPAIVLPYLALQEQFCHALPFVHDAWQQNGQQILLVEDRTQYARLVDLWAEDQHNIPQLQLLHWLYEMAELWQMLEPVNACRSLLELSNLRVDEDQAICLQRLYISPATVSSSLAELGQFWHFLLAQSQRTQSDKILSLLTNLETGKLSTIADLQSSIEAIAHDLEANPSPSTMTSSATPPEFTPPVAAPGISPDLGQSSSPVAITHIEVPIEELATLVEDEGESENDDLPTVVLPMQLFSLEDIGRTDIGRQRDHNEDYFGIETQVSRLESPSGKTMHARNLYILCDGMGGHAGGEVASALAVDTLRHYFKQTWYSAADPSTVLPEAEVLTEAIQIANKAIYDINQQNARSGSGRMGTTLVMALIQDTEIAIAHVGDSRLYRYTRKRGLEQLTVDHEVGQREIQRGVDPEIAYARPDAYQLTQALGPRDQHFIKPDIQYLELNEDALLLLCSDGLSDNDLLEAHSKTHLEPLLSSQTNLEQGINQLIELANQYNGHDNISAIAIRVKVRPNLGHLR